VKQPTDEQIRAESARKRNILYPSNDRGDAFELGFEKGANYVLSQIQDDWNDDRVIDFVNWYIKLKKLDVRYELENEEIINSFKSGQSYKLWHTVSLIERHLKKQRQPPPSQPKEKETAK